MPIKHATQTAIADDGTSDVGSDEWNESHTGGSFLESEKASPNAIDDEFDSGTLDAKWTVVTGASGTVDLMRTTIQNVYDLTTRPGWLLTQGGVSLRQDAMIADGESLVMAVAGNPANGGDNASYQVVLNTDDSADTAGTTAAFMVEQDTTAWEAQLGGNVGGGTLNLEQSAGQMQFIRICRVGTLYAMFISQDGTAWAYVGVTSGFSPTNIWIKVAAPSTFARLPIYAIAWIRVGTNGIDPWPWG